MSMFVRQGLVRGFSVWQCPVLTFRRKTNTRYWYTQNTGRGPRQKVLPRQYQQAFANKQITCVEYETLSDDQEREIFQVSRTLHLEGCLMTPPSACPVRRCPHASRYVEFSKAPEKDSLKLLQSVCKLSQGFGPPSCGRFSSKFSEMTGSGMTSSGPTGAVATSSA